jgi:predicted naringenin-chalcone synthase
LATLAASAALQSAEVSAAEITHLVTVSCTGFDAPGVDIALIDRMGLPVTVERIHVGFMGCHGAINGMRAVLGVTAAEPSARVLLCATELCSLHFCFSWDAERALGTSLFADGSAALVCGPSDSATNGQWQVAATASCLIRDSRDAITWRIRDFGYEMTLSSGLPDLIRKHLRPWLSAWLDRHELSVEQIGSWAIHPGGPKIIDAVEQELGLSQSATQVSREILRQHGNMSSPTILFIIDRLRHGNAELPCVALGFGPGVTAEAALFRLRPRCGPIIALPAPF